MIYADFESILVTEDNGRQNPEEWKQNPAEPCTSKYQKHIFCSYGYKFLCVDDRFSNPFTTYWSKDKFDNFINNIIEESKYWWEKMKKHFNKEFVVIKEDNVNFTNSAKYWIRDNYYFHYVRSLEKIEAPRIEAVTSILN